MRQDGKIRRRKFVKTMITIPGVFSLTNPLLARQEFAPVRFGMFTDPHYADRMPANNRFYAESLKKVSECVDLMNEQKVDFLICLGDLKDERANPVEAETLGFLSTIEREMKRFEGPVFHVLGNHDHDSISKQQFLDAVTNTGFKNAQGYYSFNTGSFHFIVLDTNYRSDGKPYDRGNFEWTDAYLPEEQMQWLVRDLREHDMPTVIFVHHQLDAPAFETAHRVHSPRNADEIRDALEASGNVLAVFQGHYHKGSLNRINNINYYTLKAVVEGSGLENNNYAIVEIGADRVIRITGFRKTLSQNLV